MLAANTAAIGASKGVPYFAAAKNAGMPSTIGDEPRISKSAVRAVVLWRCLCSGGSSRDVGEHRVGGRRLMVVPMQMGGAAAVPVQVDVAGQQRGVAAQGGVEPVVLRRRLVCEGQCPMPMPGVSRPGIAWAIDPSMSVLMPMRMTVTMMMPATMMMTVGWMQLAPSRHRDPAAEHDQGNAGGRVDNMAEALGDGDAGHPDGERDRQRGHHMPGPGLQCRPRGYGSRPAALPRDQRDRDPVVRHDRVQYADRGDGADQKQLGTVDHLSSPC